VEERMAISGSAKAIARCRIGVQMHQNSRQQKYAELPSFTLQVVGLASEMPVFKCATVCASNMNRSMEGHKQLHQSGFKVSSYGVGRMVLLLIFAIFRNISCITALI
jgi:hypothetical protein